MPTTPVFALPFPLGTDRVMDGDNAMESLANAVETALLSLFPVGSMILWTGGTVPASFALCDGRALSRTTFPELFAAIGTAFGAGDGSTTFNVPNMTNRYPRGNTTRGATGGADSHGHGVSVGVNVSVTVPAHNTGAAAGTTLDTVPTTGGQSLPRNAHYHGVGAMGASGSGSGSGSTDTQSNHPPYIDMLYVIRTGPGH